MFTGIIEETGSIVRISPLDNSIRLDLLVGVTGEETRVGDSVSVNGCCLTVVESKKQDQGFVLSFDLLGETWTKTNFVELKLGGIVNLERALKADGRLHGHFVTGHIDGTAEVLTLERRDSDWLLEIAAPIWIKPFLVSKGSIAIDGISLTIAEVFENRFRVWIIPHTYAFTALEARRVGCQVNIEADLLAKYVQRFTQPSP